MKESITIRIDEGAQVANQVARQFQEFFKDMNVNVSLVSEDKQSMSDHVSAVHSIKFEKEV